MWKIQHFCSFFILFFKHNPKSVWHIQTIWTPNDYSTIRNFLIFCIRAACKLHVRLVSCESKHHLQSVRYATMYVLTQITQKLQVEYGHSDHWTTALLLNMCICWVTVECEIQMVSYGFKHVWQSLIDMPFVAGCPYCIWTFCKWLLYYWRHSLSGLELYERSEWRASYSTRHTHSHSLIQYCRAHILR